MDKELPIEVTIACGLPKGDKLEWIVQKGTELVAISLSAFLRKLPLSNGTTKRAAKEKDYKN